MENMNEMITGPIRPFDDTMMDHWSMYENMPYVWDDDLTADSTLTLVSGNIIKSYRCKIIDTYKLRYN
ncbi:MAG: hypothetical protein WBI07_07835 [Mobilitalea sp.]